MAGLNMGSAGIALLGLLAVKGFQHRDELGRMLGGAMGDTGAGGAAAGQGGGLGGLLGGLGGMLGGPTGSGAGGMSSGSVLSQGLGGLVDRFRQAGQGDAADSWVQSGPNRPVQPAHLEQALGEDVIEHLQQQTGLSRQDLLARLSTSLPETVDKLTPDGRMPTEEESSRLMPPLN
jgi:uncharacterized protein YidB (DUF937 family)